MVNWRKLSKESRKEVENSYCICREVVNDRVISYMLGKITFNTNDEWEINITKEVVTIPDYNQYNSQKIFTFTKELQLDESEIQYLILDEIM